MSTESKQESRAMCQCAHALSASSSRLKMESSLASQRRTRFTPLAAGSHHSNIQRKLQALANSTPLLMLPFRMVVASSSAACSYALSSPRGRNSSTPLGPSFTCAPEAELVSWAVSGK